MVPINDPDTANTAKRASGIGRSSSRGATPSRAKRNTATALARSVGSPARLPTAAVTSVATTSAAASRRVTGPIAAPAAGGCAGAAVARPRCSSCRPCAVRSIVPAPPMRSRRARNGAATTERRSTARRRRRVAANSLSTTSAPDGPSTASTRSPCSRPSRAKALSAPGAASTEAASVSRSKAFLVIQAPSPWPAAAAARRSDATSSADRCHTMAAGSTAIAEPAKSSRVKRSRSSPPPTRVPGPKAVSNPPIPRTVARRTARFAPVP